MTDEAKDEAQDRGAPKALLTKRLRHARIERVLYDLRRGLPVLIETERDDLLVLAAEYTDPDWLAVLEDNGKCPPRLAISGRRAESLGLGVGLPSALTLALPEENRMAFIAALTLPSGGPGHTPAAAINPAGLGAADAETTAVLQLAKLAGLLPAALLTPINISSLAPDLRQTLTSLALADLACWIDEEKETLEPVRPLTSARIPLEDAPDTRILAFRPLGPSGGGPEHLALLIGDFDRESPVLVRLHSECFTGDLLGSLKCDCGDQLKSAIRTIAEAGGGVLLYLSQEGRGIGLMNKLRAYELQDQGFDTVEANLELGFEVDERIFAPASKMLEHLGIDRVRLLTNNPLKVSELERHGITVTERVPHRAPSNVHNAHYLATKARKTGHLL